jgi:hypothetical protein
VKAMGASIGATSKGFLLVTAVAELGTGLGLVLVPAGVLSLLLGIQGPSSEIVVVSRVAGSALLAIGLMSALGSRDAGSPALLGVLAGILLYDVVVAGILGYAGGTRGLAGPALWPAVVLHALLAVWCIVCLQNVLGRRIATV